MPRFFINSSDVFADGKNVSVHGEDAAHITRVLRMKPGEKLELLTGLGNGFSVEKSGEKPLLIGGGAGVPPMFLLAKELLKSGKKVRGCRLGETAYLRIS